MTRFIIRQPPRSFHGPAFLGPARIRGVSLIELMVALVLGLIVTGSALTLFLTNQQTFVATENLGRVQENARVAFELMARDVRAAAGNVCGATAENTVNVLDPTGSDYGWFANFAGGLQGYDGANGFPDAPSGTDAAHVESQRAAGTDAIELKSSLSSGVTIEDHDATSSAQFKVNTVDHDLNDGDVVMACDANHAAIFQVTNASPGTNDTVVHNTGENSPGNCTKGLGLPLVCSNPGTSYQFGCAYGGIGLPVGTDCDDPENKWTTSIVKLQATRWYVGYNDRGGRSLYRVSLRNDAGTLVDEPDEIAEGIVDMQLTYLVQGANTYVPADPAPDWSAVRAVRVALILAGQDRIGTDGQVLQRTLEHTVAIRNRTP